MKNAIILSIVIFATGCLHANDLIARKDVKMAGQILGSDFSATSDQLRELFKKMDVNTSNLANFCEVLINVDERRLRHPINHVPVIRLKKDGGLEMRDEPLCTLYVITKKEGEHKGIIFNSILSLLNEQGVISKNIEVEDVSNISIFPKDLTSEQLKIIDAFLKSNK